MDAQLEVFDGHAEQLVKLEDIFTGDGIRPRKLDRTSIIRSILLPLDQGFLSVFHKLRMRESMDFTSLTSTVTLNKNGKIKIVLSGVDPMPVVVEGTRKSDRQELIKQALKRSRAINNEMYSRNYRREMIAVFLKRSFEKLLDS
jgi:CO/xanthine dehydrogenase FAD-binding subunit